MPLPQCPECDRFLMRTMVATLTEEPTPCPRCETGLVASMFSEGISVRPPDLGAVGSGTAPGSSSPLPGPSPAQGSVRPPDLVPVMVRDEARDVLADWDAGVDAISLDRWQIDRPPFPTDAVVVMGSWALGTLVGAMVPGRRGRNAALVGLLGLVGAAIGRQVWRLEP